MVTLARRGTFAPGRILQSLILAGAVALGACGDQSATGPRSGAAGNASLSLAPSFQAVAAGAPTVTLSRITGTLTSPTGQIIAVEAKFVGDSAVLEFDLHVTGAAVPFTLDITAYDDQGVIAYHATSQIIVRAGRNADIKAPTLVYAGPDAKLATLKIGSDLTVPAGMSAALTVSGTGPNGESISPIRVGWLSSNPNIATIDDKGVIRAGNFQGSTTITATSVNNLTASIAVKVRAPVNTITLTPTAATLIRGAVDTLVPDLRDIGSNVINDRTATYTSSDSTIAKVAPTGIITALKIGKATITATAESKIATIDITVVTPIDHIDPGTGPVLSITSLGTVNKITPIFVPKPGASTSDVKATFTSSDPHIATIDDQGNITALANGTVTITVAADSVTATFLLTIQQVAVALTLQPQVANIFSIGGTITFNPSIFDALHVPITSPSIVWTSSDPTTATVTQGGVATALRAGTVTITATVNGVTATATLIIAPVSRGIAIFSVKAQINVGATVTLSAKYIDGNGNILGDAPATLTLTTPNIASLSGTTLTGLSAGVAHVIATLGGQTAVIDVRVVGTGGGGGPGPSTLHVMPATVEKLPGGTQFFTVQEEVSVSWTVNGVPGGNGTYGTIDPGGHYQAPATVPSPSSFDVCAVTTNPVAQGCAHVTINPIPTSGADVIVFNDINVFDGTGGADLNNQALFRNLVNFTGTGARASATRVMMYGGHAPRAAVGGPQFFQQITNLGYTIDNSSDATLGPIDPAYKVVFLQLPTVAFSNAEINNFKAFSATGGRIVFVGEYDAFYGTDGIAVENAFLSAMGARMTNTGGAFDCGFTVLPASSIRPHQVSTGMMDLTVACASEVLPGPNDYAIVYSSDGQHVLVAAAKVDVTPIPTQPIPARANRLPMNRASAQSSAARASRAATPTQPWNDPVNPPPGYRPARPRP